jgi:ABC-type uncharacterized transport system substrate-binding protein
MYMEGGGLLSCGVDQTEHFRRAATYVDRIFKGTSPSELPVQSPGKIPTGGQPQNRKSTRPHNPGTK